MTTAITFDRDGEKTTVTLPTRWCICGACDGEGKTSRHVESDGGGFTASEWYDREPDFRRAYRRGDYDRNCEECNGSGKVRVIEYSKLTQEQRKALDAHNKQMAFERKIDAAHAAERRAGC